MGSLKNALDHIEKTSITSQIKKEIDYVDEDSAKPAEIDELGKFAKVHYRCLDDDTACNTKTAACELYELKERKECFITFCHSVEGPDSESCKKTKEEEELKDTEKVEKKEKTQNKKRDKNSKKRIKSRTRRKENVNNRKNGEKAENVNEKEEDCQENCDNKKTKNKDKMKDCYKICACRQRAAMSKNPKERKVTCNNGKVEKL